MAVKVKKWEKIHLVIEDKMEHVVNVRTLKSDRAM